MSNEDRHKLLKSISGKYLAPFEQRSVKCPLCIECDLPAEVSSKAELREFMSDFDLANFLLDVAPKWSRDFEPAQHGDHRIVTISGLYTAGLHKEAGIKEALSQLLPNLSDLRPRFRETFPLNPKVRAEIGKHHADILLDTRAGRAYRARNAHVSPINPRTGQPFRYEYLRAPIAENLFSLNGQTQRLWRKRKQYQVNFMSGRPAVQALLLRGNDKLEDFLAEQSPIPTSHDLALHRQAWWFLDVYACNMGDHRLIAALDELPPEDLPTITTAIEGLPIKDEDHSRLIGDLATLQFKASRRTVFAPEVRTLQALFQFLNTLGYPRLKQTSDRDPRQRVECLLELMAADLDRVFVSEVDWQPLFDALTFKTKPPIKNSQ